MGKTLIYLSIQTDESFYFFLLGNRLSCSWGPCLMPTWAPAYRMCHVLKPAFSRQAASYRRPEFRVWNSGSTKCYDSFRPQSWTHLLCTLLETSRPKVRVGLGQVGYQSSGLTDVASASGSLHRLVFRVQDLVAGRGHVARSDGKTSR